MSTGIMLKSTFPMVKCLKSTPAYSRFDSAIYSAFMLNIDRVDLTWGTLTILSNYQGCV